ncbi:stromelysin-3 [Astyanax mexicanus]|uniref:Stromelysin-3 n=1 Tax=Astyanax mexicanus TaxID=7994 RepID=A0A8T2L3M9_ASTMX|nr:stromelysin-3 [Astyanax mexicanus]
MATGLCRRCGESMLSSSLLLLLLGAVVLHCALRVQSLPVARRGSIQRYTEPESFSEKSQHYGLKKRGRLSYDQDTVKESSDLKRTQQHGALPGADSDWKRRRCGVPDFPSKMGNSIHHQAQRGEHHRGRHRRRRFVLFGGRWEKTDLTYKILRTPWQMNLDKVRQVFKEALQIWSDVTPLTFSEVTSGRADIIIDFTRYWHGDNLPFDGPGGILAHAFFPKTYREGDIHFDYDEAWTLGNNMGTDLLQVAAHEFGHVLGLQHSLEPGAIMSPFYTFSYPLQLSEDDRKGIQYLYGPKPLDKDKQREIEVETERPRQPHITETNDIFVVPDACRTDFDAVSMIRGELFFFKSGYVWRIREGRLQAGYPALASRHWKGIPDNIDAAFEDKSGNIWFFQGDSYWVFDAERQITGPDSLQRLGLPVSHIQAALMWGEDKTQKVYFFKRGSYWRFIPEENRVDSAHARNMANWRGIPHDIDAAFQDRYGFAHFLKGNQYWKFDPVEVKALEGYPRYIGMDFFDCSSSIYK